MDPLSFQPSPGHASEYTASIDRGCFEGKPAGLACCRFCSSLRMLGVGEAPGCEGNISSIESHKQPQNLNAEGEDDGALSFQVIAGHWKALGFSAALWNWGIPSHGQSTD